MTALTPMQRAQREQRLCEAKDGPCPKAATVVASRLADSLDAWRFCDEHGESYRGASAWHVAKIGDVSRRGGD